MSDPAYRFTIVYSDGREMSQEDENGVVVRDHCHINEGTLKIYALTNRPKDHTITVNFENGDFSINNTRIKMMSPDMDMFMKPYHDKSVFEPVYGRRHFVGEHGERVFYFCGWKAKIDGEEIKRVMFVDDSGSVWIEAD